MKTTTTGIGTVVRATGVVSITAVALVACSSDMYGLIASRGGAEVYQQPPHRATGITVPTPIGKLSYGDAVDIVCYLPADRAYKISIHGRPGYIDDDVDIAVHGGNPIRPGNVRTC